MEVEEQWVRYSTPRAPTPTSLHRLDDYRMIYTNDDVAPCSLSFSFTCNSLNPPQYIYALLKIGEKDSIRRHLAIMTVQIAQVPEESKITNT